MRLRIFARGLAFCVAAGFGVTTAGIGLAEEPGSAFGPRTGLLEAGAATPSEAVARAPRSPEHWGSATSVMTIASGAFVPYDDAMSYTTSDFKRRRTGPGGSGFFDANVDLPAGAKISSIELEACDTDPAQEIEAFLLSCSGPGGPCTNHAAASTSGMPGCDYFSSPGLPGPVIDRFNIIYAVRVRTDGTTGLTSFRAVRVFYALQTSPAPAVATFPNDVPTTHPFFRFVEALARAGITSGCGPGSFCPDSPVTRGQIAVFLSVALGLYWTF
jgi:hypothetical protein